MFFFEWDLIPCLCPSKSIASKMRKQVLDLGCLVSVTQHQADKLSGHGRAAPYTMHASINIDKDGFPCPCTASGKPMCILMGRNAAVVMPNDVDTMALINGVTVVNQMPESVFQDFFASIAPFMTNRIGGSKKNLDGKKVIMRSFRARVLPLFNLGPITATSEDQKAAFMPFHFNNQVHGMICDNVEPGESSYHHCPRRQADCLSPWHDHLGGQLCAYTTLSHMAIFALTINRACSDLSCSRVNAILSRFERGRARPVSVSLSSVRVRVSNKRTRERTLSLALSISKSLLSRKGELKN